MLDVIFFYTSGWNGQLVGYAVFSGVAISVLLICSGLRQMFGSRSRLEDARNRRMKMIAQGKTGAERLAILKPPARTKGMGDIPVFGNITTQLRQAGFSIKAGPFWGFCLIVGLVTFLFASMRVETFESLAVALFAGLFLPVVYIRSRCRQMQDRLVHQLPDALDMLARGLKVGHPLNNSIGVVSREMEDPVATEFGIIYDQVTFGEDLPFAVQEFAERTDLEDVHYLAASIGIQHGTGGDLAGMLETLSRVIRGRVAMRRKIKALSSEGRLTAWFLSSLPFLIFGSVSFMTPDYYNGVADDPMFKPMVGSIVFLTVLNGLALRKLVDFRI
ncbi:hypothetical protein EBB79_08985 [Parasedimentitalea marina]|uniref:Type II secretion system protein GspF domain-containing protein n=1 Tax=Parasedimentitalea marina TaxID=2483033 RepID=A0A3T0N200_9RHOB|nr:type II secretion system F family protein [Parasedimentitalea marina]AZV78012.1 hypothetical protein EBB79_08985 [Parasedimentitalea marina]